MNHDDHITNADAATCGDDRTRADGLRRSISCRLEALSLDQLQLVDVAVVRVEQSTDRVRDGLRELAEVAP